MTDMAVREKTSIIMRMEGLAVSHSRNDVSIRGLKNIIDESVERGTNHVWANWSGTHAVRTDSRAV